MAYRRRYHYYDNDAESQDELVNPRPEHDYVDYRFYPLTINWTEYESDESEAYGIFDRYGYIGVALYSSLQNIRGLNLKKEKFLKLICDYYFRNFDKNTIESLNNLSIFISSFPSLEKLKQIISMKLISNIKELSVFKIIFDLYEHYFKNYDFPMFNKLLQDFIPAAELFYSEFPSHDYAIIYEYLKEQNDVFDILTKKLNINLYKFSSFYIKNLDKLKDNYKNLVGGMDDSKFCI